MAAAGAARPTLAKKGVTPQLRRPIAGDCIQFLISNPLGDSAVEAQLINEGTINLRVSGSRPYGPPLGTINFTADETLLVSLNSEANRRVPQLIETAPGQAGGPSTLPASITPSLERGQHSTGDSHGTDRQL
jgi:hypothetical protein